MVASRSRVGLICVLLAACSSTGGNPLPDANPDAAAPDAPAPVDGPRSDVTAPDTGPPPTTGVIRGKVSLRADIFPAPTGDLAGTLLVAAIDGTPLLGGQPVAFATSAANLATGPASYELKDVPPGRYMLSAMLDDNDNFAPDAAFDAGDVINPLSVEVVVAAGQALTADLVVDTPVGGAAPHCGAGALDAQKRKCVFDFIWRFAARNYPFFALKSIDWPAVKAAYEPRLDQPATAQDFHLLVAELLAELRDAHCAIAGSGVFGDVALVAGVKLAQVDGAVYCEQVAPGSAAATAGLVVGDRVLSVDGKSFADHVAAVGKYVAHPNDPWYFRTLLSAWLVGAPGSKAQIAIARDNATLEVPRVAPVPAAGPPIVAQRLAGAAGKQYGYVRIAHFLTADVVQQFDAALDGLLDVAGLILDVRENGGGESAVGNAIIARLIEKPVPVAKDYLRGSASEFYVTTLQPRGTAYKGPVAVLIDESSFSNGHLFPSQLKELGRAILVGRTTGGGSAAVERWQLTEALTVQLSKAVSITAQGAIADELGTVPDVAVTRTAADVQAGLYAELGVPAHDVVLQRALERL